jgi:two-component system, LuxR family, sensor kinase FixL
MLQAHLRSAQGRLLTTLSAARGFDSIRAWLGALLYVGLYVAVERLSAIYELSSTGVSLWSPSPALSLFYLLTQGLAWGPLLVIAALLSDYFAHSQTHTIAATLLSSIATAGVYWALAYILRDWCRFDLTLKSFRDVLCVVLVIPVGTFLAALFTSLAFVLTAELDLALLRQALRYSWIGETVGTVVLLPALGILFGSTSGWKESATAVFDWDMVVFAFGLSVALLLVFGLSARNDYQWFYLLFPPLIWIVFRRGLAGAAVGLFVMHVALIAASLFERISAEDFVIFQLLMLAMASTGLMIGTLIEEQRASDRRVLAHQADLSRIARYNIAGAMGLSVAHELSQPLSTLATYLHVARRWLRDPTPKTHEAEEVLEKAAAELKKTQDMLESLREFISRGRMSTRAVDLTQLIRELLWTVERSARARGVAVLFDHAAACTVYCDPIQIEQVLLNIVGNAIDAASNHPDALGQVTIRFLELDGSVRIEAEDNGPGIPDEIFGTLLEPFVTTKPHGMGLGLALTHRIIEMHGGQLRWMNIKPQGSRFTVELPKEHTRDGS